MPERRWSAGRQHADIGPRAAKYRSARHILTGRRAHADVESRFPARNRIQKGFTACGSRCGYFAARRRIASSRSLGPRRCAELGIQRKVEFLGKLLRIERTAHKIAPADFQRGNGALAVVGLDDDLFPGWIFLYVHFAK